MGISGPPYTTIKVSKKAFNFWPKLKMNDFPNNLLSSLNNIEGNIFTNTYKTT